MVNADMRERAYNTIREWRCSPNTKPWIATHPLHITAFELVLPGGIKDAFLKIKRANEQASVEADKKWEDERLEWENSNPVPQ